MIPDSELLRRYEKCHASDAFAELVRRYVGMVYRTALRQLGGDTHAAQEVTQAVFTVVARKASALESHGCLVGWLHTTTRHAVRDATRAASRRQRYEREAAFNHHHEAEPSIDWERVQPVIDSALGELSAVDREAILLRYFADLPFADIGIRLGLTENTARMRVDRALDKLRRRLEARGISSTSVALAVVLTGEAVAAEVPAGLVTNVVATATSAGAGSATIGSLVGLATATKLLTGFVSAIIVGSIAVLGYDLYARIDAAAELKAAETDAGAAEARARNAAEQATAVERELMRVSAAVDRAGSEPRTEPAATTETSRGTAWDPAREGKALLARHPEVRRAFADWERSNTLFQYGPLLRELHLSPGQVQRFIELMSGTTTLLGDFAVGGKSVVLHLGDDRSEEFGKDLEALLGPDGVRQWDSMQNQFAARQTTAELATSLAFSDAPLTADQSTAVIAMLVSCTQPTIDGPKVDWASATENAKSILSPGQLAAFETIRSRAIVEEQQAPAVSPRASAPPESGPPQTKT